MVVKPLLMVPLSCYMISGGLASDQPPGNALGEPVEAGLSAGRSGGGWGFWIWPDPVLVLVALWEAISK